MKKVYLAGPMSGIPEHNFPMFHSAAKALRDKGFYVFNPAENDLPGEFKDSDEFQRGDCPKHVYRQQLAIDLEFIAKEADAIAVLPGWQKSKGARAEHAVAVALGLGVIYLTPDNEVSAYSGDLQFDLFAIMM